MPSASKRSAKDVIDTAIRENRSWEWLSFALTILFAVTGAAVLVFGAIRGDSPVALYGTIVAALCLPVLWHANGIRQANLRIRLYELALAKAKTSHDAADIIREATQPPKPGGKTP